MTAAVDITLVSCRVSTRTRDYPPLGPMYLASSMEGLGYTVQLIDLQLVRGSGLFNVFALEQILSTAASNVIGISLFADALPLVLTAINRASLTLPEHVFVLGGPGVNGLEEKILRTQSSIHSVVRGEGEYALPSIFEAIKNGTRLAVPGVFSRANHEGQSASPPERIRKVDNIPWPHRDFTREWPYRKNPVVTARGCPFTCTFCDIITMWGRTVTYRSITDVLQEINYIVEKTGNHRVDFIDDTFTAHRSRLKELCLAILNAEMAIEWSCFARVDTLDEELMEWMARAGCKHVFFGIETGSEYVWKNITKHFTREACTTVLRQALNYFNVTASYIWGYPFETFQDFEKTIGLAYEVSQLGLKQDHLLFTQLHLLSPTKATPLFSQFGHTLRLNETIPLDVCGGRSLSSFADQDGYEVCLNRIRNDSELYAPFYFYESPEFERKLSMMEAARSQFSFNSPLEGRMSLSGDGEILSGCGAGDLHADNELRRQLAALTRQAQVNRLRLLRA